MLLFLMGIFNQKYISSGNAFHCRFLFNLKNDLPKKKISLQLVIYTKGTSAILTHNTKMKENTELKRTFVLFLQLVYNCVIRVRKHFRLG
jgi:hypothetical protein